jgi:hypothetical protein
MIGAVVIEIEASAVGMGNLLTQYIQALQLGKFFVVVIVLGIFSIICSLLIRAAERWCTEPWQRKHHLSASWQARLDVGRLAPRRAEPWPGAGAARRARQPGGPRRAVVRRLGGLPARRRQPPDLGAAAQQP